MSETTTSKLIFLPDEQPIQITNEAEFIVFKENFRQSYHKIYTLRQAQKLDNVLEYACYMHRNQLRDSGEPYVTHPICVAKMLLDYGLDVNTIAAALLEKSKATHSSVALRRFFASLASLAGERVSNLRFPPSNTANPAAIDKILFSSVFSMALWFIKFLYSTPRFKCPEV